MAEHGHQPQGGMNISEHQRTYKGFLTLTKWSIIGLAILGLLLAFFRTHNGLP